MDTLTRRYRSNLGMVIGFAAILLLATAQATSAQQSVTWSNPDPNSYSVQGNSIQKTGANYWGGGPSSTQTIDSGDGYVEFTATETDTTRICGLSHTTGSIDFGIFMYGGSLWVVESGNYPYQQGTVTAGHHYKVAVEGGAVKYYDNGTQFYPSTAGAPTYPLKVVTSFYTSGGTITNAVMGTANIPPTVTLTAPANNATFASGSNIPLTATAADTDGTIAKVEFYQGNAKLGESLGPQYSFTWTPLTVGTYSVTAKAFDNLGSSTTSSAPSITIADMPPQWATTGNNIFNINTGNVGIGTSNPTAKLDVNGSINVAGNINAKYQDVAEWVFSSQSLAVGSVVILDPARSNQVISSARTYDTRVAGVISEQPGLTLGERGEGKVLVATTGRVLVSVDATKGPIRVGDLLVTSDVPGVAMKSQPIKVGGVFIHRPGTIVGKALEPLAKGSGKILVLLSLQ